jgi:5-oxoprolinase (ATP-hydrolysing)
MTDRWQFWLDVGGTFTDCLARRPDGTLLRRKVLSTAAVKARVAEGTTAGAIAVELASDEPADFWRGYTFRLLSADGSGLIDEIGIASSTSGRLVLARPLAAPPPAGCPCELVSPEDAPLLAIRQVLRLPLAAAIPRCVVRLGTTKGTNALLTRRGARCALVTTRGFGDVLAIGYQNRPRLFELAIRKPAPLYETVLEVEERLAADGSVLVPLDESAALAELRLLRTAGIESLAVCLLHAYVNPVHEERLAELARRAGFTEVSLSSRVAPLMKIVPRGDTTVEDAYLNPLLRDYVARLASALPGSDLRLMTSAGGLVSPARFSGKDSILSGPAGGVVGFSRAAHAAGISKAIGFDMGGTSTDVARFDGRLEYEHETEKAGVRIVAPMLAIETVAAGGGSICRFDGVKLVVGPESAGAEPGPACYGRGGPLTITDCNLLLGRIVPDHFPFPLVGRAATRRLEEISSQVAKAGRPLRHLDLAEGFVAIANANMAQAIRSISLAKGRRPADYLLVAFGSAGPQHACAVARLLGIGQILLHPDAGVLSALGIGLADVVRHQVAGIYEPLSDEGLLRAEDAFERLKRLVAAELEAEGVLPPQIELRRSLDLRYRGVDAALSIAEPAGGDWAGAFEEEHRRRYGYVHQGRPLEIVAARVEGIGRSTSVLAPSALAIERHVPPAAGQQKLWTAGRWQEVPIFRRQELQAGATLAGPAIVVEPLTTTVLDEGWRGEILAGGELLLTDAKSGMGEGSPLEETDSAPQDAASPSSPTEPDPIQLELFNSRFTAIATQMGITLRNTAGSINVKERLDFSCAIFTREGNLVVNAPHIPVHLGAMSQTVKQILADHPDMQPGDSFATNDPYRGGSHLPDVTVVTPVFGEDGSASTRDCTRSVSATGLRFFVASRAHHAEIGGITPGSMPPLSKSLAEEGVLLASFKLAERGSLRLGELRQALLAGPYPTRAVEDNVADVLAQLAANHQGARDLNRLADEFSWQVVEAYMRHIQDAAERKLRAALARLPAGQREFVDYLDDGTPIRAALNVDPSRSKAQTIDFAGTGPVHSGNLNANPSIVTAAVIYCLRLLVAEEIPLNEGLLAPVEILLPEGILNPPCGPRPEDCPAVVGGNVETSQRVVDVLLGALELAAASQGTMNNLLFGDERFGYYETICGGSGATCDADGADAVHTHMTNTRLTDPEILERRYPVQLVEFAIRRGSGGAGQRRGGDGVVRRLQFLKQLTVSILSQRRGPYPPYAMRGGGPGALGRNRLVRADGQAVELPACIQFTASPGDVLTIETPGGGGWGAPATGAT